MRKKKLIVTIIFYFFKTLDKYFDGIKIIDNIQEEKEYSEMLLSGLRYEDLRQEICKDLFGDEKIITEKIFVNKTINITDILIKTIINDTLEYSNDIESKKPLPDSDSTKKKKEEKFYFVKQSDFIGDCHNNTNNDNDNDKQIITINQINPNNTNNDDKKHQNPIDGRTAYKDDPDFYWRFVKPIIDSIESIIFKSTFFIF